MNGAEPAVDRAGLPLRRILGRYDTGRPGPTVVIIAGVHGNEPSGIFAAQNILLSLTERRVPLRGALVAVAGNLRALQDGRRFVSRDLNRLWTTEQVRRVRETDPAFDDVEQAEQRELLSVFDMLVKNAGKQDVVFLDLHSTSAPGAPFHCISDTLHSRSIALATPIPLILGLEEAVRGTLLDFMEERGWPLILVEAGQHHDPSTVLSHEAMIWQTLVTVGGLLPEEVPALEAQRARLVAGTAGLPRVVEVVYRHPLEEGDGFAMRAGFVNFQRVRRGSLVADDDRGPVATPRKGLLLMPLYQVQGDDGFFVARPIRRSWLSVSTVMRHLRVDRLLPHLPGVVRDDTRPDRLLVDPAVARWFTVQLFHLCGYRRLPRQDGKLAFTRRVE